VARAGLAYILKRDVREVFSEMGNDPAARATISHALVDGFIAKSDSDYDDIYATVRAAETSHFLTIR